VLSNRSFTLSIRLDQSESRDSRANKGPAPPVRLQPIATNRIARAFPALLAVVAAAFVALALAGTAQAVTPCGKKVFLDWYDNGRIDHLYPLHCYKDALAAIPSDIRDYSDASDVIDRALSAAVRGELAPGGPDPSPNGGSSKDRQAAGGAGGNGSGGGPQASGEVNTSGPAAVPVPLLVLGAMSLALLAAGGLGYLSRRRKAADVTETDDDTPDEPRP
jgi:hypothetical protein